MSYEKEQGWDTHFPYNLIRVRLNVHDLVILSLVQTTIISG